MDCWVQRLRQASGVVTGKANLEVFASTLLQLAETDKSVVVVTSDYARFG
jgi:hypothetical protein